MKSFLIVLFSFFGAGTFAQTSSSQKILFEDHHEEWALIYNTDDISIYVNLTHCKRNAGFDADNYNLKFINKSNTAIKISWSYAIELKNGKCINCDGLKDEYNFSYSIKPNSTVEGNCSNPSSPLTLSKRIHEEGYTSKGIRDIEKLQLINISLEIK